MANVLALGLFYTNQPVVEMREDASHETRVVSQTYFAEEVEIIGAKAPWIRISTEDGYAGWIELDKLTNRKTPYKTDLKTSRLKAHLYWVKDTEWGPALSVPYQTRLKMLDDQDPRWIQVQLPNDHICYIQRGDVEKEAALSNKSDLIEFSKKFLNLPYTWGGRSSFGYDCSGFVQMLYRQINISLKRDSKDQVNDERFREIAIEDLEPGDLIFFGKADKRITHVGMSIGDGQFIHSVVQENMPWIRISKLSDLQWSGSDKSTMPYRAARQLVL